MVKTELVALCQQKFQESKANERLARNERIWKVKNAVLGTILTAFFVAGLGIVGNNDFESEMAMAREAETEQKYIVRYGITKDGGETILTEDGNEWKLIDAPIYEDGTEVRVLFDSCETVEVDDDEIIDITER